mmetsp:Transcript_60010/g.130156  ORF Transcript_60010/g.130156 Transcript_60010/m.130156 type:complete len:392 (-) Transcript_60010:120-1295(-)|eukprot:CAMPEP_0170600204 /NCGR_PEP_ID=MMETSP0224-20130122/17212_1 /TAXON_ID=285029 /ORGANISM="Togula jolla, Strain CCCM 725" /LENGTH=391 /DNA_ID=CAMNT_0010924919 /DNA_START=84 /DNA_END=1259 /DNA_ORIENTATION=+
MTPWGGIGAVAALAIAVTATAAGRWDSWMSVLMVLVAACLIAGPALAAGLMLTVEFLKSVKTSERQGRIGGYTKLFNADVSVDTRNADYAKLVDSYYDISTDFYEWGWGDSFHFADRWKGESFRQSLTRHEYYLGGRLCVNKDAEILDCGCGIGGPARNIARFTGAKVTGVTLNQFQVDRANTISRKEGIFGQVEVIQADFMKIPKDDNSFDGAYAIESTCHAPDRLKVYKEILRVLKPGAIFACYEWCVTDLYDPDNAEHRQIKADIMLGDGLPDLVHTSVCTEALSKAGFEVLEVRDVMQDGRASNGGDPWYLPLTPSWNPLLWPRFQFNPVMFRLMPLLLSFFELIRLVPPGTKNTQVMLQAGGIGCAKGGQTGTFTPGWLMVGRKPA